MTGLLACGEMIYDDAVSILKSVGIQTRLLRYPCDLTWLGIGLVALWYAKPRVSDNEIHRTMLQTACSSHHRRNGCYMEVSWEG